MSIKKTFWLVSIITVHFVFGQAQAVEVLGKRFDAPRIYFTAATLNKGGVVSAVRGQDNFLRLFVPAVEKGGSYDPGSLVYKVELPDEVAVLPDEQLYPHLHPVRTEQIKTNGANVILVTGQLEPKEFQSRCVANTYGIDVVLWYRADNLPAGSEHPVKVILEHKGKVAFTDSARLRVYAELVAPPPVNPTYFRFWLHYGPFYRTGKWDELADYLRRAGINAIQIMAQNIDTLKAMKERGFYVIAQRGGSYGSVYTQLNRVMDEGQAWFERNDEGMMKKALPYAQAVLWDFEPSPGGIVTNADTLARFRKASGIDASQPLDEATIRKDYFKQWIDFRQNMFAEAVRHWADWSRALKPGVETILTEGRVNVFDPLGQIDYRKVARYVTICDPMNWNGLNAVQAMREWKAAAPEARFNGCQNIAAASQASVFVSANTIMLQIASAAIMGNTGTDIYPGQTMDGENFVLFNRVMGFLGRNQPLIWEGKIAPPQLRLTPLPKEDYQVALGGGRVIRNVYPDWDKESVRQTYGNAEGDSYLAAVVNWNTAEPCYTRIQASGLKAKWKFVDGFKGTGKLVDWLKGKWMLVDREHRLIYTLQGNRALEPRLLEVGFIVKTPPSDFRGFHLARYDRKECAGYKAVDLGLLEKEYMGYAAVKGAEEKAEHGTIRFGYDDIDGDNRLEYKVSTGAQTVWISQAGHIIRWQAGETTLNTDGFGLCRDQLWLPQGERGNTALDSAMALELRKAHDDRAELALSRTVSLSSLGAMVDARLTRRYIIHAKRPDISVEVEFHNTSLAMDVQGVNISYRAHNHLRYDGAGDLWIDDGKQLLNLGLARNLSIPNTGLAASETEKIWAGGGCAGPVRPELFGEYFPGKKMLLAFAPDDPSALLQLLRWLSADGKSGTIEWMYRPVEIKAGQRWKAGYRMSLRGNVTALDSPALRSMFAGQPAASDTGEKLLFHADFNDRVDAVFAAGDGKAAVSGELIYTDAPVGRGIRISGKTEIRYRPEGNIDLARGRLLMRFMPLWDGTDDKNRFFLIIQPAGGHVYFGKLGDGRLIMNIYDAQNRQHYPSASVRSLLRAGQWYEAMVTWNTTRGQMALYLDGKKLSECFFDPWEMPPLDNANPRCEMIIPSGAEIVIDDIKIWKQT